MTKYVFITGGVVSSLGKGIAAASLGAILQACGYKVKLRKFDPYLNLDPGTMSPFQHGEVFVTADGMETDLDIGHYERFLGIEATKNDSVSAGKIYHAVLQKERKGGYLGKTVQIIPHVTDEIKQAVYADSTEVDFLICEIGGTVGDIEAMPFLEAIRQIGVEKKHDSAFIHLTLLPFLKASQELKTKPTQHSVKELRSLGIIPDIILCRSEHAIEQDILNKIALYCNIKPQNVIPAYDMEHIYEAPLNYHQAGLCKQLLEVLNVPYQEPNLSRWTRILESIKSAKDTVNIGVVGKYTDFSDAYKSLYEALKHAAIANVININPIWINAESLNETNINDKLRDVDGILVPGGFGERGVEGKILATHYARVNKVPFFGICLGMQIAVIETARNLLGLKEASSTEFNESTPHPVIDFIHTWQTDSKDLAVRQKDADIGGTMRLGNYRAVLKADSLAEKVYQSSAIWERHRHRYEVNNQYRVQLESAGLIISGVSPDGQLVEMVERKDHPFFIACQFHPELTSRPFAPNPLFESFVKVVYQKSRLI